MKTAALAALDALISSAPMDPESVARSRRAKIRPSKNPHGQNAREEEDRKARFRLAGATGEDMRRASVEHVTLQAGPVLYTLWNTRENLEAFRKRFSRLFPK